MDLNLRDYDPDTFIQPHVDDATESERKSDPAKTHTPNVDEFVTVDPAKYTSAEAMRAEWDKVFTKTWLCAGRASDAKAAGDWFRYDIGHESFVIVRGKDGVLRALYNVCQHRGNRLVEGDFGKKSSFVCRYHSWQYGLDGKNLRVTDAETFQARALCGDLSLPQVRCDVFAGFVFINMDPAAPPLQDFVSGLSEILKPYRIEDMHVVKDVTVDMNSNWKTCLHAFLEAYHVHITHPLAVLMSDDIFIQNDFYAYGHSRGIVALGDVSPRRSDGPVQDIQKRILTEAGIDPATFEGTNKDVRRAIQLAKRRGDNPLGLDYSAFSDNQLTDTWVIGIFPNTLLTVHPEGVLFFRFYPDKNDPAKHLFHLITLSAKLAEGAALPWYMGVEPGSDISGDPRPERHNVLPNASAVGAVIAEDIENLEASQRGMLSKALRVIRFSQQEQRIQYFFAEMEKYVRA